MPSRCGDIGHAGTGDYEADGNFSAGSKVAIGHETGTLLMPRGDMANTGFLQSAVKLDCMYTGYAKDGIDAIIFQYLYQYFPSCGHFQSPDLKSDELNKFCDWNSPSPND